jgi:hypothetical protein
MPRPPRGDCSGLPQGNLDFQRLFPQRVDDTISHVTFLLAFMPHANKSHTHLADFATLPYYSDLQIVREYPARVCAGLRIRSRRFHPNSIHFQDDAPGDTQQLEIYVRTT